MIVNLYHMENIEDEKYEQKKIDFQGINALILDNI